MAEARLTNKEVVQKLKEVLAAMEVKNVNRFRIRAYQNAISSINNLTSSVQDVWEDGRLAEIAGVGTSFAQHLGELFTTGLVKEWDRMKKNLPEGMFDLLVLRGVGAKTAFKLATTFNLRERGKALEVVKKAAKKGKIRVLEGFGEKSEQDILESIEELKKHKAEKERMFLIKAEEIAYRVINYLKKLPCVQKVEPLGSLRRRVPTVGDLDIAVATTNSTEVLKHLTEFEEVKEVLSEGDRMVTVMLKNDVQVDLLVSDPKAFGAMLQHFTGSKQHNILLRTHALDKGMSLSQYGIKEGKKTLEFADEEGFYGHLGLSVIPPELREGKDEIEAAKEQKLPKLVEISDVKGDLHVHTTDSEGTNTIKEMVTKAKGLSYQYIGICDHAPSVQARGRYDVLGSVEDKRRQIEQFNNSDPSIRVLFGYEINILADATISMPDDIIKKLDIAVAGIHTAFDQDRDQITKRLLSAIENPLIDIIAHPSGRLINQREAYDVDWEVIFQAVGKHHKILEINSQPSRLDLPDHLVKDAIKKGIKFHITTDAHSVNEMDFMQYGIDVARRGWCEKGNIINTMALSDLRKALANLTKM